MSVHSKSTFVACPSVNQSRSLDKLKDYLRTEAIRLLVESAQTAEETTSNTGSIARPICLPGPGEQQLIASTCPLMWQDPFSSAPAGRNLVVPSSELILRRPSAPTFTLFPRHSHRNASVSSIHTHSSASGVPSETNAMANILAQAKANVTDELVFQASMGDKKKAMMLDDVSIAYIELDEGFRRWTEEVTARGLRA